METISQKLRIMDKDLLAGICICRSFTSNKVKLVGGAGDIKNTKDGNVLLHEMQITHSTASMIAHASTVLDDIEAI
uniref:Uncharacterized protein n=1 Tax=Megaselia scalaris TaxID=36166 RepID=T1GT60_MEGSC